MRSGLVDPRRRLERSRQSSLRNATREEPTTLVVALATNPLQGDSGPGDRIALYRQRWFAAPERFAESVVRIGMQYSELLARRIVMEVVRSNFRLLARWPSKDILPTSVACDTACEALRHYRLMRKNRMKVLVMDTWEGAGSREITLSRLEKLAEAGRGKKRGAET